MPQHRAEAKSRSWWSVKGEKVEKEAGKWRWIYIDEVELRLKAAERGLTRTSELYRMRKGSLPTSRVTQSTILPTDFVSDPQYTAGLSTIVSGNPSMASDEPAKRTASSGEMSDAPKPAKAAPLSLQDIETKRDPSPSTFGAGEVLAAMGACTPHGGHTADMLELVEQKRETGRSFSADDLATLTGGKWPIVPLLETLEARRAGHYLTADDLIDTKSEAYPPPVIRAASNPNSAVLEAILSLDNVKYDPSVWWAGTTALREALRARLPANVAVLLAHSADPDGCSRRALSDYSARFLRFRPHLSASNMVERGAVLAKLTTSQLAPLTEAELTARRASRARFWTEVDVPPDGGPMVRQEPLALEVAAEAGDVSLVDALYAAGADTRGWMQHYCEMPSEPTASFLSPSTPLHKALEMRNMAMVKHLLTLGFAADVFPLAAVVCCLNPVMAAVALAPPNLDAYELLAPRADLKLRTPVFDVHILHVAVATLALPVIRRVAADIPLSAAGVTALKHSLLHIACLPLEDTHVNFYSEKIHQSIHEMRILSIKWHRSTLWPHKPPGQPVDRTPAFPQTPPADPDQQAQTAVAEYLLASETQDVRAEDAYGNTALHYLAAYRTVNKEAIAILRSSQTGEEVWTDSTNMWGFTPQDLFEDDAAALPDGQRYMPFWRDPMGVWGGGKWRSAYDRVSGPAE
ncbi:MAG: hypothetical protein M1839_001422 [Geoglossum umbratile]|nr:MAG: hypothetical protein M1839_001422 [Geoglossum umbratile]